MQQIITANITMTSREIASLTISSHDNVLKTVRRLASEGVIFPNDTPYRNEQNGQVYPEFRLSFRDTMVVVSGYSAELRGVIIDRWMELEAAAAAPAPIALPDFTNPAAAARAWADEVEAKQTLQLELAAAAPAVEFVERYADATGTKGFRQVAKLLKVKENAFREFLLEKKIMYRLGAELTPTAQHIDAGRFVVKAGQSDGGHAYNAARFTTKGITWIAGEYAKHQLAMQHH